MNQLDNRKTKAQKTKKLILETALDLFQKKGFNNVTVDEIVSEINYSKGAFYVHFKSKYEIFIEKFKEIDKFYSEFYNSLPKNLSAYEKIIKLIEGQMIFINNQLGRDLIRTVYMSALISNPNNFLVNTDRKIFKIIDSLVKEGVKTGEFRKNISEKEVTMFITRGMRGTLYDWCLFEDPFDLTEEGKKIIKYILQSIST